MEISAPDTLWVMVSTALVMLMTPGLAFFYAGLVEKRSTLNTLMMSFAALGVVTLTWSVLGYSLSFSEGNSFIGGLDHAFLRNVDLSPKDGMTIPHLLFFAFQMMFAVITPALISGAVVGRLKFSAYLAFSALWSLGVYAPLCHWVWGGGFLSQDGALDFAGGTVVHVSAGVSALVAAWVLGPRNKQGGESRRHNLPFVLLGAALLWFGWFGFNAGSSLAADQVAVNALVTTHLAAATALVVWMMMEVFSGRPPSASGAAIGAVVGLVAITPAAGFVDSMGAVIIGGCGAAAAFMTLKALERSALDDSLDVFACHGVGGIVGSILTGVFATTRVNAAGADGLLAGNAAQMIPQITSVLVAAGFAAAGTWMILRCLDLVIGIRVTSNHEQTLDQAQHEEVAYVTGGFQLFGEKAIEAGYVSESEVMDVLRYQAESDSKAPIGELLYQRGVLTAEQLSELLGYRFTT